MKLYQVKDGISRDLKKKLRAVGNPRRHLKAMGRAVVSVGKRSFTQANLRPSPWAFRKDNKPHALLQKSTLLRRSIRIVSLSNTKVIIGSDRPYATIHQLGGSTGRNKSSSIPARPYLPFKGSSLTPAGKRAVERALKASLRSSGL